MLTRLLAVLLPLGFAQTNFAQTGPGQPFPRLYAGANFFVGQYTITYPNRLGEWLGVYPYELNLGYQLRPGLAVQVGWAHLHEHSETDRIDTNAAGKVTYRLFGSGERDLTVVPTLLRYTVTRRLKHRVQFDVLGGLTFLRATFYGVGGYTDSTLTVIPFSNARKATNVLLTIGPSIRFAFGRHVEAVADVVLNRSLVGGFSRPHSLTPTFAFGLRYRFHYR